VTVLQRLRRDDEGTIILWLLGLCVVLLFVGGLSLDLWRVLSERRALAGVADAASIAGSSGIDEVRFRSTGEVRLDPALAEGRARASLTEAPDTGPLTAAAVTATEDGVVVVLSGTVPLTLMRVLLPPEAASIDLRVRAVAGPRRS
jgi:Flp pilus assembly protein TadG